MKVLHRLDRLTKEFTLRHLVLTAAILAFLAAPAQADVLATGATLPGFGLEDQHGTLHTVDASVRALILTRDMEAGEIVKTVLSENGAEQLSKAGALYVSDVSRMPGLIRSVFAEPRLRERPYPILLDREGDATKLLPSADGRPVVIVLDGLRIVRVEDPMTPEALRALLDALAATSLAAP